MDQLTDEQKAAIRKNLRKWRVRRKDVISGGNFASSNDQRLHFGLSDSSSVDQIEIHWPDTALQRLKLSAGLDRYYSIEEGKDAVSLACVHKSMVQNGISSSK
jgi:hypothetical protein